MTSSSGGGGGVRWTKESLVALVVRIVCGRSSTTSSTTSSSSSSCRSSSSSGSPPYATNGDGGANSAGVGVGAGQTTNNRRILTRSSALQSLKVLRSGRRTSTSLNSALNSSPLSKHSKVGSPLMVGGAYARHYHSYRTSSSSTARRIVNSQSKTQPQQLLQPPPHLSRVKRRRSLRSSPTKQQTGRRRSLNSPPHLVPIVPQQQNHLRPKLRSRTREKGVVNGNGQNGNLLTSSGAMGNSFSKRRSALWVLNCEAEEFLFGETAADKHELELPPPPSSPPALELAEDGDGDNDIQQQGGRNLTTALPLMSSSSMSSSTSSSPPPAKKQRRRWRETELSHLLETSPFLESKLRSSSSSTSSNSSSDGRTSASASKNATAKADDDVVKAGASTNHSRRAKKRRATTRKPAKQQNGNSSHFCQEPPSKPPPTSVLQPLQSPPELATSTSPPSVVTSLPFTFSFEDPPIESLYWESHSPIMSFAPPISLGEPPPIRLPYESKRVLNRGFLFPRRLKAPRHARKSPRCHASTLAIVAATTEENPSSPPSSLPTITTGPPSVPPSSTVPPGPMSPLSRWVHETTSTTTSTSVTPSPLRRSRRTATTTNNNTVGSNQRNLGSISASAAAVAAGSLSAQQFLWDSIQWLSDPYVVALLAGEDPPAQIPLLSPTTPTLPSSSSSASATKQATKHASSSNNERKASLRRPKNGVVAKVPTTNGKVKGSNGLVNNLHLASNGKVRNHHPIVVMEDIMKSKDPPPAPVVSFKDISSCSPPLLFMSGDVLPPLIPWTA